MRETFDTIVIGTGAAGESAIARLHDAGQRVAAIEAELIGGECAYWACVPSKTLLRAPEAKTEAARTQGVTEPALNWPELRAHRDWMIRHLDDSAQVADYRDRGITLVKGQAAFTSAHTVTVAGRELSADHIIIATGSRPHIPSIHGLDQVPVWTNREATTLNDIPRRALIIGGGAVAVELATFLAGFWTQVTIVHAGDRLLEREEPRVSEIAAAHLTQAGVTVHTSRTATGVRPEGQDTAVTLDDGRRIRADVVILAAGRRPRTDGLNLHSAGVTVDDRGAIPIDATCAAGPGLWAIGDVTAVMPYSHVGMYQGRIAADNILGRPRTATYDGIPRVVFGLPDIAAAGLTAAAATLAGHDVITTEIDLPNAITRPYTYEKHPHGTLGLIADRTQQRLLGAYAVAPLAGEWIHHASLAIRARIPLNVLRDQVAQFPTYHEAYQTALDTLPH